jgi:hypothetical protein
MASTRTPGITIDPDGRRIIDKEYRGVRIRIRLGAITQEQAEQCLRADSSRCAAHNFPGATQPMFIAALRARRIRSGFDRRAEKEPTTEQYCSTGVVILTFLARTKP